jgi:uncharacterized membrane protein
VREKTTSPRNSAHSLISTFPLSVLALAFVCDVIYLLTGNLFLAEITFYTIAVGIAGGFATAMLGLIDWIEIPQGTQAKRLGLWHGLGNGIVLSLFILSWFMRSNIPDAANVTSLIIAFVGLGLALLMAKLGSELSKTVRPLMSSSIENQPETV